jgi:branched-chain amino acid transport system ATP-binding protein
MLAIGRALMSRPRLFAAGRAVPWPCPAMVQPIGELVREIQWRENLAVVLAEQNVNWALKVASRR